MLRSLCLTFVYLTFFALGTAAPFVLTLGYLWVDTLRPQEIAYVILNQLPVSMIIGAAAVGSYLLADRRAPPRLNTTLVLTLMLALWVTLTTTWAVAPEAAWLKWDWAFKTLIFSAFVQYTIRSRIQIEAFLQVFLWTLAANFLAAAIKTIVSGGGYDLVLGLTSGGIITESSTFAAISLTMLPIIFFLRAHTRILPRSRLTDFCFLGMAALVLVSVVGTFARTGLIGMVVVGCGMWLRSRHKFAFGLAGMAAAVAVVFLSSDAWTARMATINDYSNENSAFGRILVWRWTLGFVAQHPLGGGFESYLVNQIELPAGADGQVQIIRGKAFHSVYFELLGEHGWIGLGIFIALVVGAFFALHWVARRTRKVPELLWCRDLAFALQVSLVTLLVCGAFVSIAFLPMIWYLFAISAVLRQHVARALQASPATDWRRATGRLPPVESFDARRRRLGTASASSNL